MTCERTTEARYNTARAAHGHRCERPARWLVTTPEGEELQLCTQHQKQLVAQRYGAELIVKPIAA